MKKRIGITEKREAQCYQSSFGQNEMICSRIKRHGFNWTDKSKEVIVMLLM